MGTICIAQKGQAIYSTSLGYADVQEKKRATATTEYRIGSISKTFTSVLVLKAVEEGKLTLDQHIQSFFPELAEAEHITIRHLLQHKSGINNFTNRPDYLSWSGQSKNSDEILQIIASGGSDFMPGTKTAYSNSNFVLLTFILETTYGVPYRELLKRNITGKVGMQHTFVGSKIDTSKGEAKSYRRQAGWQLEQETDMSIPGGAGAIVSTAQDLVEFSEALFGGKLLTAKSLEIMKTLDNVFGLGIMRIPFYEKTGYGHGGNIDGFSSMLIHFDEGDVTYAAISNGSAINMNDVTVAALSAVYGKPVQVPQYSDYKPSEEELGKYVGNYNSKDIPLEISITIADGVLMAQATGQSAFPLESTAVHQFKFDAAQIRIHFDPSKLSMKLLQGGKTYNYNKK
ncbi:serine hydrolase domain-containing protein [Sphingobacterium griseoflavum]|nr:serine hydrolase domain-containing protein [Sphingobacterium griseoflavum]